MVRYTLAGDLLEELSRNWWVLVLRGAAAVLFGLIVLISSWTALMTLVALAVVFGVYALVEGGVLGYAAYRTAPGNRAALMVQAAISVVLGLVALIWPVAFGLAIVLVIGAWAIVTGIAEIVTAIRLRANISSEWLLIFVGALSIVFGLLLWFWPLEGARAIVFVVGIYAIIFGVVLAAAGFRLRGASDAVDRSDDTVAREDDPVIGPEEPVVSPFDEGYAGGYKDGYQGNESAFRDPYEDPDDASTTRRGGRHRSQGGDQGYPDEPR